MAFVPPAGYRSIRIRNDFPPILFGNRNLEIAMPLNATARRPGRDAGPLATQGQRPRLPLSQRIMLWLSAAQRSVDGLWVGSYRGENAEAALQRLEEALRLIKTCDRPRYNRLTRDLDRVWVRLTPWGSAHFDQSLWACILDERFVLAETTDAEMIAGAIVHEATHARLDRCGFGYEEDQRERIEAVCNRRMLAFARKLPDGHGVRAWAEANLAVEPSYYDDAASRERTLEGNLQILEEVKPRWLGRLILAIYKAGLRRAERRRLRRE
jgi:hypothetical protein